MIEKTKKQKKKKLATVGGILCFCAVMGTYWVYDWIYPKAPSSPDLGEIITYKITKGEENISVNQEDFQKVLSYLETAKPTRQMSQNDHPDTGNYYEINLEIEDSTLSPRVYVYEMASNVYYEIPYCGIYETQAEVLSLLETS